MWCSELRNVRYVDSWSMPPVNRGEAHGPTRQAPRSALSLIATRVELHAAVASTLHLPATQIGCGRDGF